MTVSNFKTQAYGKLSDLRSLVCDQAGTTAIEYGLISSIIAAAIVVGLTTAGPSLAGIFTAVSNGLQAVMALAS